MRIVGFTDVWHIQSMCIQMCMKVIIGDIARAGMIRDACELPRERERETQGLTKEKQQSLILTHHIHLPHRVDQYNGEYCDGHAQAKTLRDVPDDPFESHCQQ